MSKIEQLAREEVESRLRELERAKKELEQKLDLGTFLYDEDYPEEDERLHYDEELDDEDEEKEFALP